MPFVHLEVKNLREKKKGKRKVKKEKKNERKKKIEKREKERERGQQQGEGEREVTAKGEEGGATTMSYHEQSRITSDVSFVR